MSNRKQIRVAPLPQDLGDLFSKHKAATEAAIMAELTDSQYAKMLISQALKELESRSK